MTIGKRQIPISLPMVGEEEWMAAREPLMSGWMTQGPKVSEFERIFSQSHGVAHSLATTSCTTGLHLILVGLGVGPGDEVIVPSFTWVATANVVLYCGAKPVFVDIDQRSFNIDPAEIKKKITKKTKAIIAVHLFGLCADIDSIKAVVGDIPIIEDAACAVGSSYKGKMAGTLGYSAAFSFHPRKIITTGEGGMITTEDSDFAEKLNILRNHGASISEEQRHKGPKPYLLAEFSVMGFNYRMTDVQAAIGIVQMKRLEDLLEQRRRWADFYMSRLNKIDWLSLPRVDSTSKHSWQSFVCMVDESKAPRPRNDIMAYLQEKGISTRPGTHAIHMLDFYRKNFQFKAEDYPQSMKANNLSIAIPLHNKMIKEDFDYIVETLVGIN